MNPINRNILGLRVDKRLAGYAALAGAALAAPQAADASVVYSGIVNYVIPASFDGIYLNLSANTTGASSSLVGWDINPWVTSAGTGTAAWRLNSNANGANLDGAFVGNGVANGPVSNLSLGTLVSAASLFNTGSAAVPPTGDVYFGLRFFNEVTGLTHYAWVHMLLSPNPALTPGTIIEFAWENVGGVGIAVGDGAVPEPSTFVFLGMMAAGALGVREWRKRKAA